MAIIMVIALSLVGTGGPASGADAPGSLVTEYAYPGAAAILEAQNVKLTAGDGHIVLADCATPPAANVGVMKVWTLERVGPDGAGLICFKVTGPVGWLTMAVPGVYLIRGDGQVSGAGHKVVADVTTDAGVHTTVNVNPFGSTPVGLGTDGDPTTLVELRVNDTPPEGDAGPYPFVAKVDVDGRGCSGVLIQAQYLATSKSCFGTAAPASAKAVVGRADLGKAGGVEVAVTDLIPRDDRDLMIAKLATPVTGITPAKIATTPPAAGNKVTAAGFGRGADDWVVGPLRTGAFDVAGVAGTTVDLTRSAGTATSTCEGSAGGPLLRSTADGQVEVLALHERSWQTGCYGVNETRDLAVETRLDDITAWIATNAPAPTPPPPPYRPIGDTNGDGRSDAIMLYHWTSGAIGMFTSLADANGGFGAFANSYSVPAASWDWTAFKTITGDYNGDHRTDVAVMYRQTSGEIWMLTSLANEQGGFGAFTRSLTVPAAAGWDPNAIRLFSGDTNGDGRSDAIMLYHWTSGAIGMFTSLADANGGFGAFTNSYSVPAGSWDWTAFKTITGDFNGDHRTDVAVMYRQTSGEIWMLTSLANEQGGFGAFTRSMTVPAAAGWDPDAIRLF